MQARGSPSPVPTAGARQARSPPLAAASSLTPASYASTTTSTTNTFSFLPPSSFSSWQFRPPARVPTSSQPRGLPLAEIDDDDDDSSGIVVAKAVLEGAFATSTLMIPAHSPPAAYALVFTGASSPYGPSPMAGGGSSSSHHATPFPVMATYAGGDLAGAHAATYAAVACSSADGPDGLWTKAKSAGVAVTGPQARANGAARHCHHY